MPGAIGAGSYIAYEEETTEGTAVTPTAMHWIDSVDIHAKPSFETVEPLGTNGNAFPAARSLFVTEIQSGGSLACSCYYDTDWCLVLMKHAYGAVATGGSGPYTYTYTLSKAQPVKPSLTLEVVKGTDGPANNAETFAGCRVQRLVRRVSTGSKVVLTADIIAQSAAARTTPTGSLSYPSGPNLAYHADVTAFVFNSVTYTDVMEHVLTVDKALARTPELGSLVTAAPIQDGLGNVTVEVRLRWYSNASYLALQAGTVAAGSCTITDGTRSIVDTYPRMQVIEASEPVSGAGIMEQRVVFQCLDDETDGPVKTVITNGVAP